MCGIWASLGKSVTPRVIDIVRHRGPDGEGWKEFTSSSNAQICMGHRRLAVLDLSADGLQPMLSDDSQYCITYNGEIYNFQKLRNELQHFGHRFFSGSDTEVLLKGYIQWGENLLPRLEGMFSFVVWDINKQRLFAARDRFGIKPLYMWETHSRIAFASECKQFVVCDDFQARLNPLPALNFLSSAVTDSGEETLFHDVRHVLPGHAISVTLNNNGKIELRELDWFSMGRKPHVRERRYADLVDEFKELFSKSLDKHLVADVKVGSCLSGGLDSSSIVSGLTNKCAYPVETFSACFENPDIDERPYMKAVIDATGAVENQVFPSSELIEEKLPVFAWHQDEPVPSSSPLAQWAVFEEASKRGVKVMLDGQGADELIGGYTYMLHAHLLELARGLQVSKINELFRYFPSVKPYGNSAMAVMRSVYWSHLSADDIVKKCDLPAWILPDFVEAAGMPIKTIPSASTFAEVCQKFTFSRGLRALLRYEDRASMAHGVEARVPFLDNDLADLCLRLPSEARMNDGWTKKILRDAMKDVLPKKVALRRDKIGFATPEAIWLTGPLKKWAIERVLDASDKWPNIFCNRQIKVLLDQCLASPQQYNPEIWRVISFSAWADAFSVRD